MHARILAATLVLSAVQCAIARGVRPPQKLGRMYPDPRLILVDTRSGEQSPGSRDAPPPPVHVVKSAPAPKQDEKPKLPPPEAPKAEAKPEPPKQEEAKPPAPRAEDPKKEDPPKPAPKHTPAPVPQSPVQPAIKQKPKAEEPAIDDEQDVPDEGQDDAQDDGQHEGGPPASETGNRRATPQGRRQFTPVRGGEHKKIKPKGVGFQFLRDMFSSDADVARLSLPLVLALLSAVLL